MGWGALAETATLQHDDLTAFGAAPNNRSAAVAGYLKPENILDKQN